MVEIAYSFSSLPEVRVKRQDLFVLLRQLDAPGLFEFLDDDRISRVNSLPNVGLPTDVHEVSLHDAFRCSLS